MAIDMKLLTRKDYGRWVLYTGMGDANVGRIKNWNEQWIQVVYNCNDDWDNFQNYTAAATAPNSLDFITDPREDKRTLDQPGIVTAEQFIQYARDYRETLAKNNETVPADLQRSIDFIASTIPENQPADYWAGFYTGMLAASGAIAGQMENRQYTPDDVQKLGAFLALAAALGWNQQYGAGASDDVFDKMEKEGIDA